ncbi:Acetokinase family protein [Rhizobium mongolense subsp. loessense]|uniref:Acetokinase family protein n=1 Tax=Rhizobium mongolense subsp. loessense TaxID=158890 RepID=A0A1G4U996_9HYPH|nr:hypothetical protein [Rhizobium mongolense]SCW90151.1 Acetokinase family protein [Rhizobium mongolense subsp. loessense]
MDADAVCLTFNAGSSTLKIGIFDAGTGAARPIGKGKIDFDDSALVLRYSLGDESFERPLSGNNGERFAEVIVGTLDHLLAQLPPGSLKLASHRVVHGGLRFREAAALDAQAICEIEAIVPLAPLHQPQALRVIRALQDLRPDMLQTASFDTAFHATQDDLVRRLAIPRSLHDEACGATASTACLTNSSPTRSSGRRLRWPEERSWPPCSSSPRTRSRLLPTRRSLFFVRGDPDQESARPKPLELRLNMFRTGEIHGTAHLEHRPFPAF